MARLVERLTHRGLLWYGVIAVVIMGMVMHDTHVDIENDVVRRIRSFSLNDPIFIVVICKALFHQAGGDLLPHVPHIPNIILLQ